MIQPDFIARMIMMLNAVRNTDWNDPPTAHNPDRCLKMPHSASTIDLAASAIKKAQTLRSSKARTRAFDVMIGSGVALFPSGLPETYYSQLLTAISQRTCELRGLSQGQALAGI